MSWSSFCQQHKKPLITLSLLVLVLKAVCFAMALVLSVFSINYRPFVLLPSIVYYILLGVLCVISGKLKHSTYILAAVFSVTFILIILPANELLYLPQAFLTVSHSAGLSIVGLFEKHYIYEMIHESAYQSSIGLTYVLMIVLNVIGTPKDDRKQLAPTLYCFGISWATAAGLYCGLVWLSIITFNNTAQYPIAYPTSLIGGCLCLIAFSAFLFCYLRSCLAGWQKKLVLFDIGTSLLMLPMFYLICKGFEIILSEYI